MSQFPTNRKISLQQPDQPAQSTPQGNDFGIGPSDPNQIAEQTQQQPQQTREQWRDSWMGAGQMTPDDADKWLSSHGATQLGEKAGVWRTPSGDVLDLQIGRGGAKATGGKITPGWTQTGGGYGPDQNNGSQQPDYGQQPWMNFGQDGGMQGGGIGPAMSRVDQFAQMFGNPQNRLKQQGFTPS